MYLFTARQATGVFAGLVAMSCAHGVRGDEIRVSKNGQKFSPVHGGPLVDLNVGLNTLSWTYKKR